jgi:hypothetical protein
MKTPEEVIHATWVDDTQISFNTIEPTKEWLRLVPTEKGFDIQIPDGIELTEAAKQFIKIVMEIMEMNSLEKLDTCEHILDMEKMVDVNDSQWISVEKRLPEVNDDYLAYYTLHRIEPAYRAGLIAVGLWVVPWANGEWDLPKMYTVTHWQPLPKPPKEEK